MNGTSSIPGSITDPLSVPDFPKRRSVRIPSYLQTLDNFNEGSPSGSGFTPGRRSGLEPFSVAISSNIAALTVDGTSGYLSTSCSTSGESSPVNAGPVNEVPESPASPDFSPPPRIRWNIPNSPGRKEDTIRKNKRFSLTLGVRGSASQPNLAENKLGTSIEEEGGGSGGGSGFRSGAAVGKLSELLVRSSGKK